MLPNTIARSVRCGLTAISAAGRLHERRRKQGPPYLRLPRPRRHPPARALALRPCRDLNRRYSRCRTGAGNYLHRRSTDTVKAKNLLHLFNKLNSTQIPHLSHTPSSLMMYTLDTDGGQNKLMR